MIRAIGLWLRRSSLTFAFPALLAIGVGATWSRTGWQYEWDWALSWAASSTILLGPIVAGLVAHDRSRRHAPTLTLAEDTGVRGFLASLALPLAGLTLALGAWALLAVAVGARVGTHDPVGLPRWTILAEVVAVLAASAFVGGAVGRWVTNRAAGPAASLLVYAAFILAPRVGLGGMFEAGGALDTLVDVRRPPAWLAGFAGLHLAVCLAAVAAAEARRTVRRPARACLLVASGLLVVLGAFGHRVGKSDGVYESVRTDRICVGTLPRVCGPEGNRPVLRLAATALADVYGDLDGSGLPLRTRYVSVRGLSGQTFPADAGVLEVDPTLLEDGAMSREDVLQTVSRPTPCAAFHDAEPPEELLDAEVVVREWIDARLSGEVASLAPADVVRTYSLLLGCRPFPGTL